MKTTKYIFFVLLCSFFLINGVSAATPTAELGFCQEEGVQRTFQIIGYGLYILKILIPIILIAVGIIDFSKGIVASDDSVIKKSASALIKRLIASIVIFLAPTFVYFVFTLVDQGDQSKYTECMTCLTNPTACKPGN